MYYAIQFDNVKAIQALLSKGANINHKYKSASELSSMRCEYDIKHTLRTPLHHAAQHASLETVKYLIEQGADITAKDELGDSILDYAKNNERKEVLLYLEKNYGDKLRKAKEI
ncbi:ankyrin repeat domain-containing protein [Zooshikella sp. RANM57]|uniref:ankyrin repeat domain-containing protein n=1 Tax=Zooshikella sp. RANM57 TaxID=3425863 RepID=UPI003D6FC21B